MGSPTQDAPPRVRFRRLLARTTAGEREAGDVLRNAALARPTPTPALGGGLLPPEGRGGAASGAGERDYDRLASHLTAERCDELLRRGYTVIDAFHGAEWSAALRAELLALAADGALAPNRTLFGGGPDGRALVFSKPHIFEADLHSPALAARFGGALREFGGWFAGSRDVFAPAVAARLPQLQLRAGDGARTVKLQRNAGGGSFPLHYDNPGGPNARALTVLVYLNAAWAPGDGGELVLVPFLGAPVKLAPLMDRAVLFLSDRVLHGTVPSRTERLAVTTWIDGDAPREDGLRLPPSALQDVEATAAMLRASTMQRAVSRAVYAEEYERGLRTCMAGAEGEAQMLAAHAAHLEAVARNAPLARLVAALRELKPRDITEGDDAHADA